MMESIERRARELLEIAASAEHYGIDYHEERLIRESDVLASLVAALTPPEGYVLVPVEPTAEMIEASMIRVELAKRCGPGTLKVLGARSWDSMLAARPEAPNVND